MHRALVALGANLGDRQQTLWQAVELLRAHGEIASLAVSIWHETAPVGGPPGQNAFLNGAVSFDTSLSAEALHALLADVEHRLGRRRGGRWEPRTIDLDLLLFGQQRIATPTLTVPHPSMAFRRFVLEPAAEVAAEMIHPTIGWTVRELVAHLNTAVNYVALLGPPRSGKSDLAARVASRVGGRLLSDPPPMNQPPDLADPSGRVFDRQIQFLDRRMGLLDRGGWHDPRQWVISDFYMDQCLAYARVELNDRQYHAFQEAWSAAQARVVSPKLLAVLNVSPEVAQATPPESGEVPVKSELLGEELLALAARRGIGPVIYLGGSDRADQLEEIVAAIAAMS